MVQPDHSPQLYPPNVAARLRFEYASPWDRPYFAADDSKGTIYVSGSGSGGTFVRASHDNGRTWGTIYPLVSDDYPGFGGFGSSFSAGHGLLVTAYTAFRVPEALKAQCPCPVLATSKDDRTRRRAMTSPPRSIRCTICFTAMVKRRTDGS